MGKGGRAPAKPAADAKREGKFVPKYEYFAKAKLASYPNEDGGCLHVEKGQDEKKFFDLDSIVKSRSGGNEELCRRMGMGIALDAAAAACGVAVLDKHFSGEWPEEVQKELRKSGLPKIKAALSTEKGKAFAAAVKVLNVGKEGQPREEDIKRAMKTFVTYVQDDPDQLRVSLARLAADTSCLYVWAMTLLKDMALLQHPKDWASKMEGKQTEVVKAWMRRPTDVEKLRKALVSELMTKVKSHKPSKGQKRKASESSNETDKPSSPGDGHPDTSPVESDGSASAAAESETAESNSSSADEKKKKASTKRKTKKEKKEKESEKAKKKKKEQEKAKRKQEKKKKKKEKEEEKKREQQEAARKKARADKEKKQAVPEVTLSMDDVSEEAEAAEGDSVYADWPHPNRVVFAEAVQDAQVAQEATNKKEKLTLSGLVSVMDNIPETILKHHQLDAVLGTLKKMDRLPRKEKVQRILASLQALADAANAQPPPAETPKETRTPTEEAPEEHASDKRNEEKEEKENQENEEKEEQEPQEDMKEK